MQKHPRAFTVIEVLIVVAIVGIVSAVTLVSFSGQRADRAANRAAHEVVAVLREAQSYALAGRTTSTSEENCWYGVQLPLGSTYTLVNTYRSGGACSATGTIATYTLKDGTSFSGANAVIGFTLPRAETLYFNGASMVPITTPVRLILTRGGSSFYICVYSSGKIIEQGKVSTCP